MINIEEIKKEYQTLLEKLGDPELISDTQAPAKRGEERSSSTWEKGDESKNSSSPFANARVFEELLKRKTFLEKAIEKDKEIDDLKNRIEENKTIISGQEDMDLISLAETETNQLLEKKEILEKELYCLIQEEKNPGPNSVIIEIRAGTGGEEAALFATDLLRMYSKYCQIKEWKQKVLDSKPTELGGFKEVTFELKGKNVWLLMKNEAGVHRVQRIPSTEKSGRIHTSTASVAVLPKPRKGKIEIRTNDLKVDTYKASGPGGQYVNKRMTAIRITHLPTGIIVNSQNERSLQQNKENALAILEAKILKKQIEEQEKQLKDERKTQIGKAERSEKIRTYNFPQNRITDHRIKKSFHNLEQIMEGKLDQIISCFEETD